MASRITQPAVIISLLALILILPVTAANETSTLSVVSIPPGAEVFINGTYAGITQIVNLPVSSGIYTVTVRKEGYDDYTTPVPIEPASHQDLIANLQKVANRGMATIRTVPPGGDLYVDGRYRNITTQPVVVENLIPGRHEILIRKTGYEDYRDVISVTTGNMAEYTEYLVPLPGTGFILITSSPEDADVIIDGIPTGKTPTNLQRIAAGNHTIELVKEGYWNFTGVLAIRGGESTVAKADLVTIPTSSTLYIDSSPRGLALYLNGTFKGETPVTFEGLPAGDYQMDFKGLQGSANRSFRFRPGATYDIYAITSDGPEGSVRSTEWLYQNRSASTVKSGWTQVSASQTIERTFTWNTNGHTAAATLEIPRELYEYYRNQPHPVATNPETLAAYAISDQDRQYLHELVNLLKDASSFKSYAARNDYRNVVAFVQSIAYAADQTEYWKYPIETLADGNGDCEDTAILTAALLKEMGYDVAVVFLPEHAAVAVTCENCNGYYYPLDGKRYYFLETTGTGFPLGTMDPQYQNAQATVIPI